jgi:hypothetical protein
MPTLVQKIDTFDFDALVGDLDLPGEKVEVFTRPGIDGHGAREVGSRGVPTKLQAMLYVADWDDVETKLAAYKAIAGTDPVTIIKNGTTWGKFLIIEVRNLPSTHAVLHAIGSITAGNPEVRMNTEWTVLYSGP